MNEVEKQIFQAKQKGLSDQEIGEKFNVSLRFIERVITKHLGVNISRPNMRKSIKTFQPKGFKLETKTVWSFKARGNWATHSGNYRGNWSPYIPRNVAIRYSKPNELIFDCFCGAGTTGVECKLTNRDFIGIDINPKAIELAKDNIDFQFDIGGSKGEVTVPRIEFKVGDAREVPFIKDESIDLICTHPPYADIIHYTDNQEQDLSFCNVHDYLKEMAKVARENHRVLKSEGHCALLIGDMRRKKHVIPLGFMLIDVYIRNGFSLKELIIKRQHNCKSTGFWKSNSIKYNFLLLAHEYLAIFKKKKEIYTETKIQRFLGKANEEVTGASLTKKRLDHLETTTVWIFESDEWYEKVISNLIERYDGSNYFLINGAGDFGKLDGKHQSKSIILVNGTNRDLLKGFCDNVGNIVKHIKSECYLAILCNDVRLSDGTVSPHGVALLNNLKCIEELKIKEIVMISIENNGGKEELKEDLDISHKYLFIYRVERGGK